MRYVSIAFFSLLISTNAIAKCGAGGIYVLTTTPVLNQKPIIIIEFHGSSQSLINDLNKKYPIYLKSKNTKISLLSIEFLKGDFQTTQVIFRPSELLSVNDTYQLFLDNLPEYEKGFNQFFNSKKTISYKISKGIDKEQDLLTSPPIEIKKTRVEYGCGPAEWVYFNIVENDKTAKFARAIIKNISTGKTVTFLLPLEKGSAKVGHGMCGGMISFKDSKNFEIKFSLVDISGNMSNWSASILFSKPIISTIVE